MMMHYKVDGSTAKLNQLGQFVKEMGLSADAPESSLKVTSSSVPEETQVVVLAPAG